jgi:hypothetical protein
VAEPTITLNREFLPVKAVPVAEPVADWVAIDQGPRAGPRALVTTHAAQAEIVGVRPPNVGRSMESMSSKNCATATNRLF